MNIAKDRLTGGACIAAVIAALLYGAVPEIEYWPRATVRPNVEARGLVPESSADLPDHPPDGPRLLSQARQQKNAEDTEVSDKTPD